MDSSYKDDEFYKDHTIINEKHFDPEKQMWVDGLISKISAGYESKLDGDIYYIGICDDCTIISTKNSRLRYVGDYLSGYNISSKYSLEELNKFDQKRLRENNLDDLV